MSKLEKLKQATTLHGLAALLGFKPKALSYILYKKDPKEKYRQFEIPKRTGGMRTISAPCPDLMNLQRRLADLLQECIAEINAERKIYSALSHGFRPKFSIYTNAFVHRNRRYVLNLDLENFFGTINFGRVRGFFITNKHFSLEPKVATLIAQIACFDNVLPQGSPCSPVISNLIGHLLDIRLAALAHKHGCSYSRYADDITFSTNKPVFPVAIAQKEHEDTHYWNLGAPLNKVIEKAGFTINSAKTRMQYTASRQEVTGLVVNKKVNTRTEYRHAARAMVHRLLTKGEFFTEALTVGGDGKVATKEKLGSIEQLNGMLSFIDSVNLQNRKRALPPNDRNSDLGPAEAPDSFDRLYRRFLFFKHFFAPTNPVVICEGKTDNIYLQCAIRSLGKDYSKLADTDAKGNVRRKISFFRRTYTTDRILGLSGGTAQLVDFLKEYQAEQRALQAPVKPNPTILLVDNDDGAKGVFGYLKNAMKLAASPDGSDTFYCLSKNLYVVATPSLPPAKGSAIEDFFPKYVLDTKLGGKSFNPKNEGLNLKTEYGKSHFATHVVKKNEASIDFTGFKPILDRLEAVISHHSAKAT